MKTRAAVAWQAGKPLVIESVDLAGPKAGEVMVAQIRKASCRRFSATRVRASWWKSAPAWLR